MTKKKDRESGRVESTVMRYDIITVDYGYNLIDKIENKVIEKFRYNEDAWKRVGELLANDAIKDISV